VRYIAEGGLPTPPFFGPRCVADGDADGAQVLNLEEAIGYVASDELIEVTPSAVRLRKRILDPTRRRALARSAKGA
jgi:hypothetical protein